ncbi:hypothetical protein RB195_004248 [Necator americanus]|uniref:MADF domain-containing protein n=1 Tax=Necator americanus TaxID=51031 RepID=A0ABR1BH22_NECAM
MSLTVRYRWTTPLREALVKSVGKREKLWKKFPVVSHDMSARAKLWSEVAEELMQQFDVHIDTYDMKKTWKNLKDNYWRITKAFDTEPERAMKWKFYDAMRFMDRANIDESHGSHSPSSDSHCLPSSSDRKPKYVGVAEDLLEEPDDVEDDHSSPPLTTSTHPDDDIKGDNGTAFTQPSEDVPLQLKGISGNSGRFRRRGYQIKKAQEFVQISIPALDRFISAKQRLPFGTLIQCMPIDHTEDILTSELEPIWKKFKEEAKEEMKAKHAMYNALNDKEQITEWVRRTLPEVENPETKLRISMDLDNKFVDLIKMVRFNCELGDENRAMVVNSASRLRGIYHQGAFALFVKQNMPKGTLQKLLDAFDDFVYNKQPRDPVISKVIEECDPSVHTAFVALFSVIERYGDELNMECPDNRWARVDKESKGNIDRSFQRRKRKYDLVDFKSVEHDRIANARAKLATQIKNYTATVNSTHDLLAMVDEGDHQTRAELTETLRRAQEALEKTTEEQQQLEVHYRELQNLKAALNRRKEAETALDPETVCTPIAATDLLENGEETSPIAAADLFDNTVKKEPQ